MGAGRGRARRLALVSALVVLAGCGGQDAVAPPPDPCPPTCPGSPSPVPAPTGTDPAEGSAAYDALVVEPEPGELARGGNDEDAALTVRDFDILVTAGARLRTRTVCQGRTAVTVTTDPPSGAESELPCTEDALAELIVEEPAAHPVDVAYHVVVTAPEPSRWYVVLSAVEGSPAPS